jgi:hypothetical protein
MTLAPQLIRRIRISAFVMVYIVPVSLAVLACFFGNVFV